MHTAEYIVIVIRPNIYSYLVVRAGVVGLLPACWKLLNLWPGRRRVCKFGKLRIVIWLGVRDRESSPICRV